jgi:hypothetical protein
VPEDEFSGCFIGLPFVVDEDFVGVVLVCAVAFSCEFRDEFSFGSFEEFFPFGGVGGHFLILLVFVFVGSIGFFNFYVAVPA